MRATVGKHGWLAAVAFVILALWPAQAAESDLFKLEWSEAAPGIYVGIRPDVFRYPVVANSVIVVGEKGALVFSGGGFPTQGEEVLAELHAVTKAPLLYVVISSWHGDHNRGIWPLLEAYPDAKVVGTQFTHDAMLGAPLQDVTKNEQNGGAKEFAAAVDAALKAGKAPDGSPLLGDDERAFWARFVADSPAHQAELARMRITPPTVTFEDTLDLDVGGRAVKLIHPGPANSKGDAALWVADARFLASGEMMVAPVPYGFKSYPRDWANVLRALKALNPAVIVPGHGPIMHDMAYADLMIETLESVAAQVDAALKAGTKPEDIKVDFSAVEPRFTQGGQVATRLFGFFFKSPIVPAAANVARGIENEPLEEKTKP